MAQDSFFCNLNLHHLFFSIFGASRCLWGLSWEGFGPSGASLGRVLAPLGAKFSRIEEKLPGFLVSLPFFVFTYCGSPVIWSPLKLFHPLCPFDPLTNISNISNIPNISHISIMSNIPAWRNARSV